MARCAWLQALLPQLLCALPGDVPAWPLLEAPPLLLAPSGLDANATANASNASGGLGGVKPSASLRGDALPDGVNSSAVAGAEDTSAWPGVLDGMNSSASTSGAEHASPWPGSLNSVNSSAVENTSTWLSSLNASENTGALDAWALPNGVNSSANSSEASANGSAEPWPILRVSPRRLSGLVSAEQAFSEAYVGNVRAVAVDAFTVAVAYMEYAPGRRGFLSSCSTAAGDGALSCGQGVAFTSSPVHTAPGSLAMTALTGSRLFLAWREGAAPFVGRAQMCLADLSVCGRQLVVRAEWDHVAAAAHAVAALVYAYADRQRGHRGVAQLCDVAGLSLLCLEAQTFESRPVTSLAILAMPTERTGWDVPTGKVVISYDVEEGKGVRAGVLLPCEAHESRLACYGSAAAQYNMGPSEGSALAALSQEVFVVTYADRRLFCPWPDSQPRRRARHVCRRADGHPSIAMARACRMVYSGLRPEPELSCGEGAVVDDGYETQLPALAARNSSAFAVAYGCSGCSDLGARGLLKECHLPADGASLAGLSCGEEVVISNTTAQWGAAAALESGMVVAYGDYGGTRKGVARVVS